MRNLSDYYTNNQENIINSYYRNWLINDFSRNPEEYFNLIREIRYGNKIPVGLKPYYDKFFKKYHDIIIQIHFDFYSFKDMTVEEMVEFYRITNKIDNIQEMFVEYKLLSPIPEDIIVKCEEYIIYD